MSNHRIGNWGSVILSTGMLVLILVPGCNTANTSPAATAPAIPPAQAKRIAELQSDYDQMPEATRKEVAKGFISRGQSPDMVYIALGRPDRIVTSADGRVTSWTYVHYFPPTSDRTDHNPTRKSAPKSLYRTQLSDPLQDNMQAWMHNVEKNYVPLNSTPQFSTGNPSSYDPSINRVPRAPGQSWADYARYVRNQEMAVGPAKKSIDDQARAEYREALTTPPIKDLDPVKLNVVFLGSQVSDAFINDAVSAFATQP